MVIPFGDYMKDWEKDDLNLLWSVELVGKNGAESTHNILYRLCEILVWQTKTQCMENSNNDQQILT